MTLLPKHKASKGADQARAGPKRPDLRPSKTSGVFLRFDCVIGKAKVLGAAEDDLLCRTVIFHADLNGLRTGWLDFDSQTESAIVGEDRDNPPPGAENPRWGFELTVASPYPQAIDNVEIKSIPPHYLRSTTALLMEALAAVVDEWFDLPDAQRKGAVALLRLESWSKVVGPRGKTFYAPHFKLLGTAKALDKPVSDLPAPNDSAAIEAGADADIPH